jgi:hypothetical protein
MMEYDTVLWIQDSTNVGYTGMNDGGVPVPGLQQLQQKWRQEKWPQEKWHPKSNDALPGAFRQATPFFYQFAA